MACGSEASVLVRFAAKAGQAHLGARDTRDDLRAGSARARHRRCAAPATRRRTPPVATVLLHWNPFDSPLVSVEVQDELTNKRVLRDLRLGDDRGGCARTGARASGRRAAARELGRAAAARCARARATRAAGRPGNRAAPHA